MKIEVVEIRPELEQVLVNLLELYQHDFSEFDGSELGDQGTYGYPYIDHYWSEPGRHPFVIRVNGRLAGFALVRILPGDEADEMHMAEFFIVKKHRRQGVGKRPLDRSSIGSLVAGSSRSWTAMTRGRDSGER